VKTTNHRCRLFKFIFGVLLCQILFLEQSALAEQANGLNGRLILGYQGWFGCPGDDGQNKEWQHWFPGHPNPQEILIDMIPSQHSISTSDLCDTGLKKPNGGTVYFYSTQNPNIVFKHFEWLQENGIDGIALQRFVHMLDNPVLKVRHDNLIKNVMAAANKTGRVFFITYDTSGADPSTVSASIRADWFHLVNDLKITNNTQYLFVQNKPVLELWGFGFNTNPANPQDALNVINDLKSGNGNLPSAFVMGGVPSSWRTLKGDSYADPNWTTVYHSYNILSPWTVGRFNDDNSLENFLKNKIIPDMAEARRLGIGYMPVIFPGYSFYNNSILQHNAQNAIINKIPRRCGRFLWRQSTSFIQAGATMLYGAMFDEVNEGTALMPTETVQTQLPNNSKMVYLNQDGCSLPDDWYLKVSGKISTYLKNGQVPPVGIEQAIRP